MAQGKTATKTAATEGKAVRMVRDPETYPEPHKADVHPAEVENFKAGGWATA
jgi:hypothetical protein